MPDQPALHFVAYDELGDTPNIVVDGAGNAATLLTLSHWPKSGTPRALKADSSAEIVFNYLAAPASRVEAAAVSNNHFDEDGLVGLHVLLEPEAAAPLRDLLIDVAEAGDFATCRERRAARIAFTISAFADPERSPLEPSVFALPYGGKCAALYRALLPRLGEMLADTERFRPYWEAEDAALSESERALAEGQATIEEVPPADLAVVTVAEGLEPIHRMAVHNATRCNRVLVQQGRCYAFTYRYESWVQYITRPPPPRADLAPLAEELSAEETGAAAWRFDGVDAIVPHLTLEGSQESAIAPEAFRDRLAAFLAAAPPAWDPYDPA